MVVVKARSAFGKKNDTFCRTEGATSNPFSHRRCELQFENYEFAHRGTRKLVCLFVCLSVCPEPRGRNF